MDRSIDTRQVNETIEEDKQETNPSPENRVQQQQIKEFNDVNTKQNYRELEDFTKVIYEADLILKQRQNNEDQYFYLDDEKQIRLESVL